MAKGRFNKVNGAVGFQSTLGAIFLVFLILKWVLICETCCRLAPSPPLSYHPGSPNRKSHWKLADDRNTGCIPHSDKLPTPQKQGHQSARADSPSSQGSSPSPRPHCGLSCYSSASDLVSPDVIIEECFEEEQEQGVLLCH